MQGRLSPRPKDRLQAFPWRSWKEEFRLARNCGFSNIEWLFEADDYTRNPLWTTELDEIGRLIAETGVKVRSVCADYFMPHRLFGLEDAEINRTVEVLSELIRKSAQVGVEVILIPVLEISEVQTESDKVQLLENLQGPLALARSKNVILGLETELPAAEYRELIERGGDPNLRIYYDTGNAAAKGFDIDKDLELLGPLTCGIHIKDRKLSGPSVRLGEGAANFSGFFKTLRALDYSGTVVLQTAFGDDPISDAQSHLAFVKNHLQQESIGLSR
jgi:hexulose-6-phosphate isomerase